jgi:hypothetical protein
MARTQRKTLLEKDRRKLVGMLNRLSSDQDPEVLVSAKMAVALLQKHNVPWDDIITDPGAAAADENIVKNAGPRPRYPEPNYWNTYHTEEDIRRQWEEMAREQAADREEEHRKQREARAREEARRRAEQEQASSPYLQYNAPQVKAVLDGMDSTQAADFCIRSAWLWSAEESTFLHFRFTRWTITEDELRRLTGMYEKSKVWGGYPKGGARSR